LFSVPPTEGIRVGSGGVVSGPGIIGSGGVSVGVDGLVGCDVAGIVGWGITGIVGWGITGIVGWGITGIVGWGITGRVGWGITGRVGWGVTGRGDTGRVGWGVTGKVVSGAVVGSGGVVIGLRLLSSNVIPMMSSNNASSLPLSIIFRISFSRSSWILSIGIPCE
jgi:hypothetical protein